MKEITAYVCEFCPRKKARMSKGHTKRHEAICFHNPARRACATCGNLQSEMVDHNYGPYDTRTVKEWFCEVDYFNSVQPSDSSSERYRSDCEKWISKTTEVTQ